MSYEARMQRDKRFNAADYLERSLVAAEVETGAGWPLALVDGVIERLHLLSQVEVETLTDAVQSAIEGADYVDFGEPDTRDMAERAVNTVFAFLGLRGEAPSVAAPVGG